MDYDKKDSNNAVNEKASFVIALVALLIAASSFRNELSAIKVDLGFAQSNIFVLLYISFGFLTISLYIYAIDYVRYGLKRIEGLALFKYLQVLGNAFYFIAVFSPIIYLLIWIIAGLFKLIPSFNNEYPYISSYIAAISGTLCTIVVTIMSLVQMKNRVVAQEETIEESASDAAIEAHQLLEKDMWNFAIIEGFKSLELNIRKKLLELGVDSEKMPFLRSIETLKQHGILTTKELDKVHFVRMLRNKAVHSTITFEEYQARDAIKDINEILPKLETKTTSAFMFEKNALKALGGGEGLFPRHHIFIQPQTKDFRYDAKAEGPSHEYMVEVKMTKNASMIKDLIRKFMSTVNRHYRIIIIVPDIMQKINTFNESIKILYYSSTTNKFINRAEIKDWIYREG